MQTEKTWFVTHAGAGLGLALARRLLAEGHRVAAAAEDCDALIDAVGAPLEGRFLPLALNLASQREVRRAASTALAAFGRVDVLVNCGGAGPRGTLEELDDAQVRRAFDDNVFGMLNVLRVFLPQLRLQGAGHVFNVSSVLGFDGEAAGWGAHSAGKFAASGLTEALAAETEGSGIRVTLVYPGALDGEAPENQAASCVRARAGRPSGDVDKAAAILIQAAQAQHAPRHLFLGRDAFDQARGKIHALQQELARWREMSIAVGRDDLRRLAA
ncbi:SDR family NAD(P)-dependent oxidoreductase [Achromobacter sp. Marseille-Q4962]|uniref:SDR family NAD(P)-dependent oxidoreductase n=1 Tax=Achromobacter sp. Marseille-Q4962 TaxID=2942202 RepID=UPI0020730248|nr:SDR family NAD(P)-dependent oxidoreductase [Achromobacter sp. Marseille-Q4962]